MKGFSFHCFTFDFLTKHSESGSTVHDQIIVGPRFDVNARSVASIGCSMLERELVFDKFTNLAFGPQVFASGGHEGGYHFLPCFKRTGGSRDRAPGPFEMFGSQISFEKHTPGDLIELCGAKISIIELDHPGTSYGYRIEANGVTVIYSTDAEHRNHAHGSAYPYVDFIRGADLLIFDAPYTHSQSIGNRENWGHSSNIMAVELAAKGEIETLALFHHDPAANDEDMVNFLSHTKKFLERSRLSVKETKSGLPGNQSSRTHPGNVIVAYDGLSLEF